MKKKMEKNSREKGSPWTEEESFKNTGCKILCSSALVLNGMLNKLVTRCPHIFGYKVVDKNGLPGVADTGSFCAGFVCSP